MLKRSILAASVALTFAIGAGAASAEETVPPNAQTNTGQALPKGSSGDKAATGLKQSKTPKAPKGMASDQPAARPLTNTGQTTPKGKPQATKPKKTTASTAAKRPAADQPTGSPMTNTGQAKPTGTSGTSPKAQ